MAFRSPRSWGRPVASPAESARSSPQEPRGLRPSPRSSPPASGRRRSGAAAPQDGAAAGCGNCGRPVDANAKFCAGCGAPAPGQQVQLQFCACGRLFSAHERFCATCGRPAAEESNRQMMAISREGSLRSAEMGASPRSLRPSPRSPRALSPRTIASMLSQVSPRSPRGRRGRPDWVPPLSAPGVRSPSADALGSGRAAFQQDERPQIWPSAWPGSPTMMAQPSPGRSARSYTYAGSPVPPLKEDLQIIPYSSEAQNGEAPIIPPTRQEIQASRGAELGRPVLTPDGLIVGRMSLEDDPRADPNGAETPSHIIARHGELASRRMYGRSSLYIKFFGSANTNLTSGRSQDNLGSVEHSWGRFIRVPIALVMLNFVVIAIQFTVYLTAVGWVESEHVKRSNVFVRGLPNILVPGLSLAIYATIGEFLDRQMSFFGGVCSMLLFTACCTAIAAVPWYDLGFVVQVMGGMFLHNIIVCVYFGVRRGNKGDAIKDSIYGFAYLFALFSIVCILFVWGFAISIFWPTLDEKALDYSNDFEQPQKRAFSIASGLALSLACNIGEGGAVGVLKRLDKHFYKRVPNSRRMGSWAVMFIHSVSESFRLATLWYSAILSPESNTWIYALISSLVLNTVNRMGWQSYIAWRLTCKNTFWIPGCWTFVHREAKFAFGYCRFGAPLAVFGTRYILSFVSKSESLCCTSEIKPYFNDTVLQVIISSFISELLEDSVVAFCTWKRLDPSWYADKTVRAFSCRTNDRDLYDAQVAMWFTPNPYSKPVHKVHYQDNNFESRFVQLGITSAATFLVYTGLICLVSLDFFLGFSGEHLDAIGSGTVEDMKRNGGLLWRLPGE